MFVQAGTLVTLTVKSYRQAFYTITPFGRGRVQTIATYLSQFSQLFQFFTISCEDSVISGGRRLQFRRKSIEGLGNNERGRGGMSFISSKCTSSHLMLSLPTFSWQTQRDLIKGYKDHGNVAGNQELRSPFERIHLWLSTVPTPESSISCPDFLLFLIKELHFLSTTQTVGNPLQKEIVVFPSII